MYVHTYIGMSAYMDTKKQNNQIYDTHTHTQPATNVCISFIFFCTRPFVVNNSVVTKYAVVHRVNCGGIVRAESKIKNKKSVSYVDTLLRLFVLTFV